MRVLVTGDWHIGVSTYGVVDEEGRNSRLADVETAINRAVDIAMSQSVSLFVLAGDVFHTNRPTAEEQLIFWRFLQRVQRCAFNTRIIIGNHDHNSRLGASHALKLFLEITSESDRIKIYDQTTWELFKSETDDQPILICFYPYHAETPDFSVMQEYGAVHATALVCHSHLEGAVVGAEPFEIRDDKATKFSELPVNFVWAGHFHKPQVLCYKPLAFYPGSIQPVDFNERFDVKGVVIVNTSDGTYECAGIETRKFIQIDMEDRAELTEVDLIDVVDAVVKVNTKMTELQAKNFDEMKIRKVLTERGAHSIASINLELVREEVKRNPAILLDSDLGSNFQRFIKDREYGNVAEVVKETGMQIIKQCGA